MRVWERTLRYEVDDRAGILGKPVTENYIGALWHNRLLIFPLVLRRFFPNRPGAALISASRDGDLLTDAIHRFGYDVIRGSSSRLGASAILQLTEELASGRDVVITPDGPRGPAYELGPGIVFLAQKSDASGVANESGIFALLAAGKLGPLHHPATIFESARADQPTASRQTDQHTRGIRGRTPPRAGRDDVAG